MTPARNSGLLGSRRGVTLIELILFSSMTLALIVWVSSWMSKPARIQQKFVAILDEQKALRATDTWVNDVKQMMPGSLRVDASLDLGTLAFQIAGDATPPGDLPGTPTSVLYDYQPEIPGSGGSLYRTIAGSTTVILSGLLNPESSHPLFRLDPSLHILTVDLRLKSAKGSVLRVVRRVSIPN